jgi:exodeoxyribonuclease-3
MKVMTWNLLLGGADRFRAILEVIETEAPDLLILEECMDWEDGVRLAAVADRLRLPADAHHVHLGRARARASGRRFNVAVVSRAPLRAVRDHASPPLAHCLVELELGEHTVLGAHFDSHGEDQRLTEARHVLGLLAPEAFAARPYLLCGDLNAISESDPYPSDLAARVAAAGLDKYGHPPRFDVIRELETFGWVDALRARPLDERWITAPAGPGPRRPLGFRTDYILCSPLLLARLESARVVDVGGASDHNAVVATVQ